MTGRREEVCFDCDPDPCEKHREPDSGELLAGIITAAELHNEVFDPLVQFVHGIVQEGFGIVAGPPKLGKSWWTLNLALAVASGGRGFGKIQVEEKDVLLLALEDSHRRLQGRIRTVFGSDIPPKRLHLLTVVQTNLLIPTITAWLQGHPGGLIILDTLGRARQQRRQGEDPYLADYKAGVALKQVVDAFPGSALLGVHHSRKASSDDFVDDLSGTLGLAGSADYVLVLRRPRGSDQATLQVTGRDAPEGEYAFTVCDGAWTLAGQGLAEAAAEAQTRRETKSLGDRALEVLSLVNDRAPASHTTARDVADALGIDGDQARVYLNRLASSDRIAKIGRGAYTSVTSVTTVTDNVVTLPITVATSVNGVDVTNETDVTPHCACGAKLLLDESLKSGQCMECYCSGGAQ